jgi:hypothetical protein
MFKRLTIEDKLKAERAEKMELLKNQAELEAALFDLAQIVSDSVAEAQNGEAVL